MSHFVVIVVGPDYEKQLAPYDENLSVAPYVIHSRRNASKELKREVKRYADIAKENMVDVYNIPYCKEQLKKYQAMTPKQYWDYCVDGYENDVHDGNLYSSYSKMAKWDWYALGGRWMGFFRAKEGAKLDGAILGECGVGDNKAKPGHYDQIEKGDVDFDGILAKRLADRAKWWDEVQKVVADGKANDGYLYFEYGIEKGDTRESYIGRAYDFGIFAIVKNGIWYEQAEMGWFGSTHNKKMTEEQWGIKVNELILGLPGETMLTACDCHI